MLSKQGSFILKTVIDNQNTIRIFTCLLYCAADEARFVIGWDDYYKPKILTLIAEANGSRWEIVFDWQDTIKLAILQIGHKIPIAYKVTVKVN